MQAPTFNGRFRGPFTIVFLMTFPFAAGGHMLTPSG
jgi:hypothetical protein